MEVALNEDQTKVILCPDLLLTRFEASLEGIRFARDDAQHLNAREILVDLIRKRDYWIDTDGFSQAQLRFVICEKPNGDLYLTTPLAFILPMQLVAAHGVDLALVPSLNPAELRCLVQDMFDRLQCYRLRLHELQNSRP